MTISFKEFILEQDDLSFLLENLQYNRDSEQEAKVNRIGGDKIHPLDTRAYHTADMSQHGLHVVKIHNRATDAHEFHITKSGWDGATKVDTLPHTVSKHVHTILNTEIDPYLTGTHKVLIQTTDHNQYERYKRIIARKISGSNKKMSELGHIPLTSSPSVSAPAFLVEYDLSNAMRIDGGRYSSVISLYECGTFVRLDVQQWLYPATKK